MKGAAEQCKSLLTEESLRKFIIEEAAKRCKFADKIEDEDEIRKADKVSIILAVLNTATEDDLQKLELYVDGLKEKKATIEMGIQAEKRAEDLKRTIEGRQFPQ